MRIATGAFADNLVANAAALEQKKSSESAEVSTEASTETDFELILEDVSEPVSESAAAESSEKAPPSVKNEETSENTESKTSALNRKDAELEENTKPSAPVKSEDSVVVPESAKNTETAKKIENAKDTESARNAKTAEGTGTGGNAGTVGTAEIEGTAGTVGTAGNVGSLVSAPSFAGSNGIAEDGNNLRENAIVRAIRRARPAVVNIRGEKTLKTTPDDAASAETSGSVPESQHVNGMGTGVLFDSRGYIVTNFHVVDGIQEIHVTTVDTKTYVARVLARDKETDLAIIKIDALAGEVFDTIPLGESTDLMSGETVIAVGNAFGYEHTVTRGIVSALHRSVQVSDVQFYEDLIQTDASINPGNSGGPLLNIEGNMIGINVAVRAGAQGIGFAIPVNRAMDVVTRMMEAFSAEKNWHGIQFVNLPAGNFTGAIVESVEPNSPAEAIGLRAGDRIVEVNRRKITNELDFACAILELKAGETVRLAVSRNEKTASVRLAMGVVSSQNHLVSEYTPEMGTNPQFHVEKLTIEEIIWKQLGMLVTPVAGTTIPVQGSRQYNGGLLVQNVRKNSPAARQGIRNGDVLLGILRWETLSLDNVVFILNQPEFQEVSEVKFLIARGGKVHLGHFVSNEIPPLSNLEPAAQTASAALTTRK